MVTDDELRGYVAKVLENIQGRFCKEPGHFPTCMLFGLVLLDEYFYDFAPSEVASLSKADAEKVKKAVIKALTMLVGEGFFKTVAVSELLDGEVESASRGRRGRRSRRAGGSRRHTEGEEEEDYE